MTLDEYKDELLVVSAEIERTVFIQKNFFNGIPFVFKGREGEYYNFTKRIADNFDIRYTDINIVGSSRFGFSPYKFTEFSFESDIDVTICNEKLFEKYFELVSDYIYKIKDQEIILTSRQDKQYRKFLKYFCTGWMRPDLLPTNSVGFIEMRTGWDEFFKTISYGKSEVGNYKVKAGLFKSQAYAEKYYMSSIAQLQKGLNS